MKISPLTQKPNNQIQENSPRYRAISEGLAVLSPAELISNILQSEGATNIGRSVLETAGSLADIERISIDELLPVEGLTKIKALALLSAVEFGKRIQIAEARKRESINSSQDAYEILKPKIGKLMHEEFWVMFLNRANKIISLERISQGGYNGTVADPRIIFKAALLKSACSIILAHNHPSGNNKASEADIWLTRRLKDTGEVMDIVVLDHVIVTADKYLSFAEEGLI